MSRPIATLAGLLLSACVSSPQLDGWGGRLDDLAGTEWRLETIGGRPAHAEAWIAFDDGGRAGGRSGCNTFGATYRFQGSELEIDPAEMTKMACDEPAMRLEADFIRALEGTRRTGTSQTRLVLIGADGTALATFVPRGSG